MTTIGVWSFGVRASGLSLTVTNIGVWGLGIWAQGLGLTVTDIGALICRMGFRVMLW